MEEFRLRVKGFFISKTQKSPLTYNTNHYSLYSDIECNMQTDKQHLIRKVSTHHSHTTTLEKFINQSQLCCSVFIFPTSWLSQVSTQLGRNYFWKSIPYFREFGNCRKFKYLPQISIFYLINRVFCWRNYSSAENIWGNTVVVNVCKSYVVLSFRQTVVSTTVRLRKSYRCFWI